MDEDELDDLMLSEHNTTDELYDFNFELTAFEVAQDSLAILFTIAGLLADIVIIYMIARNVRMRSKTNLLLLNFAINDAFFLVCNVRFLVATLQIFGEREHYTLFTNCVFRITDVAFQINQLMFLLILISNTLMKSKRIQIKWLLITAYTFITVNFLSNLILCHYDIWHTLYFVSFLAFLVNLGTVLFKEINNCYKNWYKKDPLSQRTRFRLTIGRIYVSSWSVTIFLAIFGDLFMRILVNHSLMTSVYILMYIVYADKNFKICLLNLLQRKGAGSYDVDATITFAEDYSEDGDNQIDININNTT